MARARPPLSCRRRRQRWGLPLLLLSTPRNMAVLEASISSAASTSAVVKRGRPRQYIADELRERKNDIHAFACTTRNGDVEMDACVADTEEPKDTGKKSGYKCLVCHEMVHRMYEFLTDAHAHRCFSQRQLICGHCLVGFPNFSDLMSHVTQIGADRRYVPEASASPGVKISNYTRFPCSLCSAYFTSSSARDVHEARHARKNVPVPVPTPQSLEVRSAEGARAQAGGEQTTQNGAQRKPPGIAPSRRELSHYATTVVCSLCNYSFVNLRRLDEHYRSCHGAAPLPLDLVFEEDFEYTLRPETLCSVCVKRRSCVDTIQRLLEEATKDGI
ncbi:uncharacterized protein ISCGN_032651 [Ixodes scapularis]